MIKQMRILGCGGSYKIGTNRGNRGTEFFSPRANGLGKKLE